MSTHSSAIVPRIALIEDDTDLRQNIEDYLLTAGYAVWGVASAEEFYRKFLTSPVDVVIVDIGLPGEDGLSVTHYLREMPGLSVIIQTAHDMTEDRVAGLKSGAVCYLVKPVDLAELVVNIEAVSRRNTSDAQVPKLNQGRRQLQDRRQDHHSRLTVSDLHGWRLSKQDWRLTCPKGNSLFLTAREFILLRCLIEAAGEIVSKSLLCDSIVGRTAPNRSERLDVLLARLRKKCVERFECPLPVKTMHQVGYLFTAQARLE